MATLDITLNQDSSSAPANIRIIHRSGSGEVETAWPVERIAEALDDAGGTTWVDVCDPGAADNRGVEAILRDVFQFHPLAIEDALKDTHIPKIDDWVGYLYVVFSLIDFEPITDEIRLHELDIFLGPNYLLTYHNEPLTITDQARMIIERDPGQKLRNGADRLLASLLDSAVAAYLPAIEHLDLAIDVAQDEVFDQPTARTLQAIFKIKRSAARIHRMIAPMREVLNRLARDPYTVVGESSRVYFRDVYDDLVRLHDVNEGLRDLVSGALETHLSVSSNRTNEIMKALTVVTVRFLPLSFLVGFFGMNFFGDNLAMTNPLPRSLLFWGTIALMFATPRLVDRWVRSKGWS